MSAGERIPGHLHCRPGAEVHPGTGVGLGRKYICQEGPAKVNREDKDLMLQRMVSVWYKYWWLVQIVLKM